MPASTSVKLNTGAEVPTVEHKSIDTAAAYGNEAEVGQGIKASGVSRESFFLTTKLDNPDQKEPDAALASSLSKLGVDYLDLWLMHWPAPMTKDTPAGPDFTHDWLDTWKSMERLYKANPDKLKAIGVSNFSVEFMERLLAVAEVVPAVNQIELHPSCPQHDVVEFCEKKGIVITAYSPLGSENSPLLTNSVVTKLAEKHGVAPANILISLQANKPNVTVLSKSVTNSRIQSNSVVVDLTTEEMEELDAIDKSHHFRVCNPDWTGFGSLGFPNCK
ncbi:Aldo-ket-red domain-containing protein [Mycena kentingensis (nom. inval.)]|nr:Aldo-ket-red domain-containing protein [Mycena kentingensis (nom. inval.)]